MSSQVMFGKTGLNSRTSAPVQFTPAPQVVTEHNVPQNEEPEIISDNLNNIAFSLGNKNTYIAQDKSMIWATLLWFFGSMSGAHRFYLGHKFVGLAMLIGGVIIYGSLFGSGISAVTSVLQKEKLNFAVIVSTFGFALAHFTWTFLDIFYVSIRKFVNTHF